MNCESACVLLSATFHIVYYFTEVSSIGSLLGRAAIAILEKFYLLVRFKGQSLICNKAFGEVLLDSKLLFVYEMVRYLYTAY